MPIVNLETQQNVDDFEKVGEGCYGLANLPNYPEMDRKHENMENWKSGLEDGGSRV